MIKVEEFETSGWQAAFRGMRNPLNSWDKSDSWYGCAKRNPEHPHLSGQHCVDCITKDCMWCLGVNDLDLATRLIKAGTEHRKFLRMIHVQMDITAPLYFWKEADQYKVGTTTDSCSTMHCIHSKEFTINDFSHEHLDIRTIKLLESIVNTLNDYRNLYVNYNADDFEIKGCPSKKMLWWQMIQILPSSYNQRRTWDGSMETILNILHQRKGHKLDEWETFRQECFDNIPYCKEFYKAMHEKENNND